MLSTLKCAEEKAVGTLAFPAMGSGYYGIPPALSAKVMVEVLKDHLQDETSLTEVVICVLDTPQYNAFEAALAASS